MGKTLYHIGVKTFIRNLSNKMFTGKSKEIDDRFHFGNNENVFQTIVESANVLIWIWDIENHFSYFSPAWLQFTGMNADDEKGDGWLSRIHPDDLRLFTEVFEAACRQNSGYHLRFRLLHTSGYFRMIQNIATPYFDHSKTLIGYIGHCFDVSDQINTSSIVVRDDIYFRRLIEKAPDGIVLVGTDGYICYASPSARRMFGYSDFELISPNPVYSTHPDDIPMVLGILHELYQDPLKVLMAVYRFKHKDGEWRWVESTFSNQLAEPEIKAIVINFRDVTERLKTEQNIRLLRRSVEQSPVSILITDINGLIEYVNPKVLTCTGYSNEELIGQNLRIFQSDENPENNYSDMWNMIHQGKEWHGEFHSRKKNGEYFWEDTDIAPVFNEKAEITHFIAVKEDITEKKMIVENLMKAKEKAEESDRLKTAFLANLSHEIRTPLNSIIGFSELLVNPDFNSDQSLDFVELIKASGSNLLAIINDIIDISRIETGQIEITKAPISIYKMLESIRKEYWYLANDKKIELLLIENQSSNDLIVYSDVVKLKQIVVNLVVNALKFTDKGSVKIGVNSNDYLVTIYVQDTGIGIGKEFHEQIFDRFRQLEPFHTRKYGGNGLGLAISKNLIELLGGRIRVESEPGTGSTFYVDLPVGKLEK